MHKLASCQTDLYRTTEMISIRRLDSGPRDQFTLSFCSVAPLHTSGHRKRHNPAVRRRNSPTAEHFRRNNRLPHPSPPSTWRGRTHSRHGGVPEGWGWMGSILGSSCADRQRSSIAHRTASTICHKGSEGEGACETNIGMHNVVSASTIYIHRVVPRPLQEEFPGLTKAYAAACAGQVP